MKKRGKSNLAQTTIFIIIALIIVAGIALSTYLINQNKKQASEEYFSQSQVKPQLDQLKSNIIECAEETSKNALTVIGIQGGYYKTPNSNSYYQLNPSFIPYYYDKGSYLMPSKSEIQNQLSVYVNENINDCLNSISDENNFKINYRTPKTLATIKEKEVLFEIDLNSRIEKENYFTTFNPKDNIIRIDSELYSIYEIAEFLTESHKEDPAMYCINCVAQLAENNNLYVDIVNFRENEMLIVISENHTSSEPYLFEFMNRYKGDEISPFDLADNETAPEVDGEI